MYKDKETGKTKILLKKRNADDPFYANQWAVTGTKWRPGDTKQDLHDRIINSELAGIDIKIDEIREAGTFYSDTPRGPENMEIHYAEILEIGDLPENVILVGVKDIPIKLVEHHGILIKKALINYFLDTKRTRNE